MTTQVLQSQLARVADGRRLRVTRFVRLKSFPFCSFLSSIELEIHLQLNRRAVRCKQKPSTSSRLDSGAGRTLLLSVP